MKIFNYFLVQQKLHAVQTYIYLKILAINRCCLTSSTFEEEWYDDATKQWHIVDFMIHYEENQHYLFENSTFTFYWSVVLSMNFLLCRVPFLIIRNCKLSCGIFLFLYTTLCHTNDSNSNIARIMRCVVLTPCDTDKHEKWYLPLFKKKKKT